MGKQKRIKNTSDFPDHVIQTIARCLLPSILEDFENEDIQKEFEEWKKKQA